MLDWSRLEDHRISGRDLFPDLQQRSWGHVATEVCPALVLNADFRPLSYFPLSLWSWQETIKAVFLGRVQVVQEYDRVVRSPSWEMRLPSVICLKKYAPMERSPAFTRFNVFLRDFFTCQYCATPHPTNDLTLRPTSSRAPAAPAVPPGRTW